MYICAIHFKKNEENCNHITVCDIPLLQIGITTHVHMCHETITDIELFNNSNITCTIHTNSHCCSTENNHNSSRNHKLCATSHSGDDINCCEIQPYYYNI